MFEMRYLVRVFLDGGNYSAMVPDLPGCVAAADTVEETLKLMAEAIGLHLELMRESGEKIPKPTQRVDLNIDDLEEGELCTWVEVRPPAAAPSPSTRLKSKITKKPGKEARAPAAAPSPSTRPPSPRRRRSSV
jgi:predicted RNase H-like HicB family nuclease